MLSSQTNVNIKTQEKMFGLIGRVEFKWFIKLHVKVKGIIINHGETQNCISLQRFNTKWFITEKCKTQ